MPRTARAAVGGMCYHVLNRGNNRSAVFHKEGDYEAFLKVLGEVCAEIPLRPLAYCLMPNHFHLVVWPEGDGDLGRALHRMLTAHVRRYHKHYQSSGHIWQGRFKAFPIEDDDHLLTVLRYVERNPLRAAMVTRAEEWSWSSLGTTAKQTWLHPGPVKRSRDWTEWVNEPLTDTELEQIRQCAQRGTPYGSAAWVREAASKLGLESTLRTRGRPRKEKGDIPNMT